MFDPMACYPLGRAVLAHIKQLTGGEKRVVASGLTKKTYRQKYKTIHVEHVTCITSQTYNLSEWQNLIGIQN